MVIVGVCVVVLFVEVLYIISFMFWICVSDIEFVGEGATILFVDYFVGDDEFIVILVSGKENKLICNVVICGFMVDVNFYV